MARRSIKVIPEEVPPYLRLTVDEIQTFFNMLDEIPTRYAATVNGLKQYLVDRYNTQHGKTAD